MKPAKLSLTQPKCVQEIRSKARYFVNFGIVPTLDSWLSVAKSDTLISQQLHDALYSLIHELETEQKTSKQHSNSKSPVKDLIDPSMYPLVYGRTRGFRRERAGCTTAVDRWSGKGKVVPKIPSTSGGGSYGKDRYWSENYQWLPANLEFEEDGSVCFTSYINNLHPVTYLNAYVAIEKLVATVIPLWDQCLSARRLEPRLQPPHPAKYGSFPKFQNVIRLR